MPRLSCVPSPAASCAEGPTRGLREITRAQWDTILTAARCTILNSMSNDKCDSYVLSESSLFVYSHKMVLKTCGTTTLLMALEPLLEITTSLGMVIEWLAYTRKDFIFPQVQKFPHRAPQEEVRTGAGGWPDPRNHVAGVKSAYFGLLSPRFARNRVPTLPLPPRLGTLAADVLP
jgi:hypothetical protein